MLTNPPASAPSSKTLTGQKSKRIGPFPEFYERMRPHKIVENLCQTR
jgi:hypothetical protein